MSKSFRLSKKQRKMYRERRRQRQNQRSVKRGEYGTGKTSDKNKEYEDE